ncbi:MAG: DUF5320 domain-containing protein [Chloroflexi bacterium]|nr:DUF5320 domain-containing protein [Chloroflexota bacterium]
MPAKDRTGPLGQGSRTGRGLGNCNSTSVGTNQPSTSGNSRSYGWGGRVWDTTFGRLFRRRRAYRTNQK